MVFRQYYIIFEAYKSKYRPVNALLAHFRLRFGLDAVSLAKKKTSISVSLFLIVRANKLNKVSQKKKKVTEGA